MLERFQKKKKKEKIKIFYEDTDKEHVMHSKVII